jgi:hypothetical protein
MEKQQSWQQSKTVDFVHTIANFKPVEARIKK